jgi:GTP 3',8-cyclase
VKELVDQFGRVHRSLRISVTDRCNIRCQYCMPDGPIAFLPRTDLLTYEEICRFVDLISMAGVTRIRLTGGEPLVRAELHRLVAMLKANKRIESIAITTNAMLLSDQISSLQNAGLDQINISLDTLHENTFQSLSRRKGLDQVLEGIDAAIQHGYRPRLNAVLVRGLNEDDAIALVEFATARNLTMRFIEFMPLDFDHRWNGTQLISGDDLRVRLSDRFGTLRPIVREDSARPSQEYEIVATGGRVGFIDSVTAPFCSGCDRLRLTAEGRIRNCLFGKEEWDVRKALRNGEDSEIESLMEECIQRKYAGHGIGEPGFVPPERAMYQIGG